MEKIIVGGKVYDYYDFKLEDKFESKVVEYAKEIFGADTVYFDIKRRISNEKIISIPDGYLIDFTFEKTPKLYIIENELANHDVYKHIGEQILRFAVSYKGCGHKLKEILLKEIEADNSKKDFIQTKLKNSDYRNIDDFLEDIIFKKEASCIVIIDKDSSDLQNVLGQLKMNTDIITFQAFKNGSDFIYKYSPFQEEIREIEELAPKVNINDLDTLVVPARDDGFNEVFLNQDCWYAIKISSSMLSKIKYIASYQTAPVSAITYYAEVAKIEKYMDTNKYIVYFKNKAEKLKHPIELGKKRGLAPQSPRYTNIKTLLSAKSIDDVFC